MVCDQRHRSSGRSGVRAVRSFAAEGVTFRSLADMSNHTCLVVQAAPARCQRRARHVFSRDCFHPGLFVDGQCRGFVDILMAMSVTDHMSLAEVKNRLSQVVEDVETEHARVTITKHGRPAAVIISADDLGSLEETLALLSDGAVMDQIRASREELNGEAPAKALTKDEMIGRIQH